LCSQVRTRFGSQYPWSFRLQLRCERGCSLAQAALFERVGGEHAVLALCTTSARLRMARIGSRTHRASVTPIEEARGNAFGQRNSLSTAALSRTAIHLGGAFRLASSLEFLTAPVLACRVASSAPHALVQTPLSWARHDSARWGKCGVAIRGDARMNARMHALRRRQGQASGAIHCRPVQHCAWRSPKRAAEIGPMSELTLGKWSCAGAPDGSGRAWTV
jgi:hypothetical protein